MKRGRGNKTLLFYIWRTYKQHTDNEQTTNQQQTNF